MNDSDLEFEETESKTFNSVTFHRHAEELSILDIENQSKSVPHAITLGKRQYQQAQEAEHPSMRKRSSNKRLKQDNQPYSIG